MRDEKPAIGGRRAGKERWRRPTGLLAKPAGRVATSAPAGSPGLGAKPLPCPKCPPESGPDWQPPPGCWMRVSDPPAELGGISHLHTHALPPHGCVWPGVSHLDAGLAMAASAVCCEQKKIKKLCAQSFPLYSLSPLPLAFSAPNPGVLKRLSMKNIRLQFGIRSRRSLGREIVLLDTSQLPPSP